MPDPRDPVLVRIGVHCRRCAVMAIAAVWRSQSVEGLHRRMARLPLRKKVMLTGAVLGFLFLLALFSAQFGPVGLMLYFAAVLLILR